MRRRKSKTCVVEVPQRNPTVRNLKPTDRFEGYRRYTLATRRFDAGDNSVTELFEVVTPEETQRYLLRYRLYSREELVELLAEQGLPSWLPMAIIKGRRLSPRARRC